MGIQINGQTDIISATDGSLTVSGADLPNATNLNVSGVTTTATLRATSIVGVTTAGITTAYIGSINDGPLSGARNRIINGDMRIDQRNAGVSTTPANGTYTLDRWNGQSGGASSKYSIQQNAGSVTPPVGFTSYIGATSLSAYTPASGDWFGIEQRIEGNNISDFAFGTSSAKTITLSFWVRSSLNGTFGGSLYNDTGNRSYPFTYFISSINTWEYKIITIPGDTSGTWQTGTGIGLQVIFSLGASSSLQGTAGSWASSLFRTATGTTNVVATNGATFYLTGVQLEVGTVATPFERRSFGQELALCQRYYQKSYELNTAIGTNTSNGRTFMVGRCTGTYVDYGNTIFFPVRMRSQPTMKFYTQTGTADSWFNTSGTNPNPSYNNRSEGEFSLYVTDATTAGQAGFMYGHWTSSAEL